MYKIKKNNIAIVCSTLPYVVLDLKIKEWGIKKLFVPEHFKNSYKYLKKNLKDLEIIEYKNNINSLAKIFVNIISLKISNNCLYFFHECSFVLLDIFILTINPNANFYPQVSLDSFKEINYKNFNAKLSKFIFWFPYFRKKFKFLEGKENPEIKIFFAACKYYPINTKVHSLNESINMKKKYQKKIKKSSKIILITSRDIIEDEILRLFYIKIADILIDKNFQIFQKDHPRDGSKLNLEYEKIINIDPNIPIETIAHDFSSAISVCSTGILAFNKRAISTIYMHKIDKSEIEKRVLHLKRLDLENEISYPRTFNQLTDIVTRNVFNL